MAKFSRSSTAYKQDGSVVNAGVPRFETNGVMVEEGTVNLLPSANQNKLVNGTPNPNLYQLTTGLVQGGKYTLSGKKRIFADDLTINTRTGIAFYYSDSSVTHSETAWNLPKDGLFYDFTITGTADSAKTLTKVAFWMLDYSSSTFMHQECQNVIAEQKPYATSFHQTTRAGESLTIPASAIPVSEGTIKFDCVFNLDTYVGIGYRNIIDFGSANSSNRITLFTNTTNGKIALQIGIGTAYEIINTDVSPIKGVKYRFAIPYKTKASIWINGVKKGSSINNHALSVTRDAYVGSHFSNFVNTQPNAIFSNLHISNTEESDTELSYTGALSVDEYTTYFCSFNGNLSATCRPVMLVQGQGQVLLSRVGRGTRSIKVQGSGQVKLKRSACYYPTIAVGTKGEVKLSRQGIGYRKMKVEGQGSFKIQEPNIEIYPSTTERECDTEVIERVVETEVVGMPYIGDTVKLRAMFKTIDGVLADPSDITLTFYSAITCLQVGDAINIGSQHRVSTGVYEVDYVVPDGDGGLKYKWQCMQGTYPQVKIGKMARIGIKCK